MSSIDSLIHLAIQEDCPKTDITCESLNLQNEYVEAIIIAKEDGIFFGCSLSQNICSKIDSNLQLTFKVKDGQVIQNQQTLITITGPSLSLLRAERILLNFLQRLCGIATTTNRYIQALNDPKISVLDTRKTTPGMRELEKQAVVAGGGKNHRHSLSDMVLIKENHLRTLAAEGQFETLETLLIQHKQNHPHIPIEIEVETIEQLQTFPLSHVDFVMFDNFSIPDIKIGVEILKSRRIFAEIEVSGGITLENIHTYRHLPIHRISIGALTHSVKALDLSLLAKKV